MEVKSQNLRDVIHYYRIQSENTCKYHFIDVRTGAIIAEERLHGYYSSYAKRNNVEAVDEVKKILNCFQEEDVFHMYIEFYNDEQKQIDVHYDDVSHAFVITDANPTPIVRFLLMNYKQYFVNKNHISFSDIAIPYHLVGDDLITIGEQKDIYDLSSEIRYNPTNKHIARPTIRKLRPKKYNSHIKFIITSNPRKETYYVDMRTGLRVSEHLLPNYHIDYILNNKVIVSDFVRVMGCCKVNNTFMLTIMTHLNDNIKINVEYNEATNEFDCVGFSPSKIIRYILNRNEFKDYFELTDHPLFEKNLYDEPQYDELSPEEMPSPPSYSPQSSQPSYSPPQSPQSLQSTQSIGSLCDKLNLANWSTGDRYDTMSDSGDSNSMEAMYYDSDVEYKCPTDEFSLDDIEPIYMEKVPDLPLRKNNLLYNHIELDDTKILTDEELKYISFNKITYEKNTTSVSKLNRKCNVYFKVAHNLQLTVCLSND